MLSTDVAHILNILSAIYQTEYVFVLKRGDDKPCLQESIASSADKIARDLQGLSFEGICQMLNMQSAAYMSAKGSQQEFSKLECANQVKFGQDLNLSIHTLHANIEFAEHLPSLFFGAVISSEEPIASEQVNKALSGLKELLITQVSVREEDIYQDIANLNKDFIYVKNKAGEIVFANCAILSLFQNVPNDDSIKNHFFDEFEKNIELVAHDMQETLATHGVYELEHSIMLPDNTQKALHTAIRKFETRAFSDCVLFVSRDITEREVLITDLKRSNYDLDSFAYVASHDLKAPLNVIKRLVSWVMEDCADVLPKDSMDDLGLVLNRANRMEQLLKDLLDYSRIGKDYHQAKILNVKAKVLELLPLLDLPMGFSMQCDDLEINVPEVPFGIVLLNLIANAIKHHDSGNAKIQIKVRKLQTSNVVTVIDNGPGIEEANRQRIFELFETLKPRDEVEGSGMGLSVVKRLVEQYGGNIKVESNRPRGTKFIVHWPLNNMAEQVLTQLGTATSKN